VISTLPPDPPDPPEGEDFDDVFLKLTEPEPPAPEWTDSLISSTNMSSLWDYID